MQMLVRAIEHRVTERQHCNTSSLGQVLVQASSGLCIETGELLAVVGRAPGGHRVLQLLFHGSVVTRVNQFGRD